MSWIFTSKYLHISDLHILLLRIHMTSVHLHISDPHISDFHIVASSILINRSFHLRSSYLISSHQIAAHLRIFIAQLLQSSLSLHIFGSSSPSNLINFKISVCHCYNLIDLRLQNFMSINNFPSLSGQPSSSFTGLRVVHICLLVVCLCSWPE